jgi:hypothetical protein
LGLEIVCLARIGGKQAILKRADHRFIELIEFVSHREYLLSLGSDELSNAITPLSGNAQEAFSRVLIPNADLINCMTGLIN